MAKKRSVPPRQKSGCNPGGGRTGIGAAVTIGRFSANGSGVWLRPVTKGSAEIDNHDPTGRAAVGPTSLNSDAHCVPGTLIFAEAGGLGWSVSAIVLVPPSTNPGFENVSSGPSTTLFRVTSFCDVREAGSY